MARQGSAVLASVLGLLPFAAVAADAAAERSAGVPPLGRAAELYSRNCQGCHGHKGVSVAEVPSLKDRVGWFLHSAEGREYVVRVPGVAFAHLPDGELAAVLNWMLTTYSSDELPPGWSPFTAEEVGRLRGEPVANVVAERSRVVEGLVSLGVIRDAEAVGFGAEPNY